MFSGSQQLIRHSLRRTASTVLVLLTLQLGWTTPAPAQASSRPPSCLTSGLPDQYLSPNVLRLEIDQEDLLVTVIWPEVIGPPDLMFVLSTPTVGEIAFWPAEPMPGEATEQRLDGALAQVSTAGFQHLLELRNTDETLGWRHFRVAVNCADGVCEYQTLSGLESEAIEVSEAFWNALDEAQAGGSTDLLDSVRNAQPELAAEIPGFAWQSQQAESRPGEGCDCRWLAVQRFTPGSLIGPSAGLPPRQEAGVNDPGASFSVGVQTVEGRVEVERNETQGTTVIGLQLFCTSDLGGTLEQYPTAWPSLPTLEVREPTLTSCRMTCTPLIDQVTYVRGCAEGGAQSAEQQRAFSRAEMDASSSLNGQATIAGAALVELDFVNNDGGRLRDSFLRDSLATVAGPQAIVELHAGAQIKAEVPSPNSLSSAFAFAVASTEYAIELVAPDICGIPQGSTSLIYALPKDKDGGVAMERWDDS